MTILKVVSVTYCWFGFCDLKESIWKNVFLFHFKSSCHFQENQILIFQKFKFHGFIKCWSIKQEIHFIESLGLLMKFGQLMSYYKRKFIKKFYKNCDLKTSSNSFVRANSIGKWNFWSKLLILDMYQQNYQNLSESAHRLPQIPFYRRFPENWKGSGTNFRATFFRAIFFTNFLMKNFLL